jgi:signal transduction histidine kinase
MSIRLKMIIGIGLILVVIVVAYAVVALRMQATHELNTAVREAELIANVADRAISIAMEQGKSEELQKLLERIGSDRTLASIRILDPEGTILRSSNPGEIGAKLLARERPSGKGVSEPIWDYSGMTVGIFRTIPNGPSCYSCHPREREQLGLLNVRASLLSRDLVSRQLKFMILSGVIGLLAAGVLMGFLFTVVVGRRIDSLSRTMQQVEAGDLAARASEKHADELGRLSKSFNTMVTRLAEEQQQREDRHAEEIRHAEQVASLGKMAAVGTITSGIAHELNNPLNNIGITTEALIGEFASYPDHEKLRMLRQVQTQVGRASSIVGNLLDFTRQEPTAFNPVSIPETVEAAVELVGNELSLAGVTPRLDLARDLPEVMGNPRSLEQVFVNLFLNSIQAMPAGGTLEVRAARANGELIRVDVTDSGAGISSDDLSKIFVPFFTTKEPGKGTGLGLSVSYGIIKKHHGRTEVESEVGKGTTVSILLPVKPGVRTAEADEGE